MPAIELVKRKYTVRKSTSQVYKVRLEEPYDGWAHITIEEWDGGGSFSSQGDFGEYNYVWGCIGEKTLREFLISLDYQYFMGKANNKNRGYIFSADDSYNLIKQQLLKMRYEEDFDKEVARDHWSDLVSLDLSDINHESEFMRVLYESPLFEVLYYGDPHNIETTDMKCPSSKAYWDRMWPVICEFWKEELKLS